MSLHPLSISLFRSGHCVKLAPDWDRLSVWAREEHLPISIAKLDGTEEIRTSKRFDIRGFPTLKLFSGGQVYDYEGPRTLDALKRYVENREWTQSTSGKKVPGEITWNEHMKDYLREQANGLKEMVYRKPGGVAILMVIGFLVGILARSVRYWKGRRRRKQCSSSGCSEL
jgi:thioredoxin-like negative regulator of GroEL